MVSLAVGREACLDLGDERLGLRFAQGSGDAAEGVASFLEKRAALYLQALASIVSSDGNRDHFNRCV